MNRFLGCFVIHYAVLVKDTNLKKRIKHILILLACNNGVQDETKRYCKNYKKESYFKDSNKRIYTVINVPKTLTKY